nr:hypothetical protein [Tanacetum cinerariifolium]
MNEAVKVAVHLQSDRLRDEAQAENEYFLNKLDENIQKIIKEQVKEQVEVQVSKILPKIEKTVNEQLEAEVLTRASNSSKTSYDVVADLSKVELKKILIEKMESNNASTPAEELMQTTQDLKDPAHLEFETDTLTLELIASPTYEMMKGSCKSLPLPLIPNSRGRRVIPFDHFINNDLEYLRGGASSRKYTTSVTKIKEADYGHIKWIEDLVPHTIWSQVPVSYDKYALWGISHWGRKHQQFYGFAVNRESARDVYAKRRIIAVTKLQIVKWHNYKHPGCIIVRRDDDKLYKFKEGDLKRLRIQDIDDMLLLLVQGKLTSLTVEERFVFNVSLRIDGTLNDVRTSLDDRLKGTRMKYLPQTIWRRSDKERAAAMI